MAKKPFSVSDYIKPEDVSKLDTEATAISFIPRERLLQNEKNFYDTSSIDELADSIALNGLIEPIIVRPVRDGSGGYRIISGHRRFLAICELAKDEPERWARVPAIIREPASDVLEELLLIEANRATRVMSSADTMRQAERYRELLAELKRQGVEIPGRLRDAVAEAMQISASRLARLDVIRKNLSPEWMEAFETGSLSESAAYELARLPQEQQTSVRNKAKGNPTAQSVTAIASELSREADAPVGQSHETNPREKPEADERPVRPTAAHKLASSQWKHLVDACSEAGVSISEVADTLCELEEDIQFFISGLPDGSGHIWSPEVCSLEDMLDLSEMTGLCVNALLGRVPTDCTSCKWADAQT